MVTGRAWRWALLGVSLPLMLWLLVPAPRELAAVALHAHEAPAALNAPFELATPTGIARLRALVAVAPERRDWRRTLALALEDAGRPAESMAQWRHIAAEPRAKDEDVRTAARELIGHRAPAEGVALLERLAGRGRLTPAQLLDAAEQAGAAGLWDASARLLEHLAKATPEDAYPLELLARVRERAGDTEGGIAAWRRRFALSGSTPAQHLAAAALLERAGRPADALALLEQQGGSELSEWRERASLAWGLNRAAAEIEARRAILRLAPGDEANRLALGDRLGASGDTAGAERLYNDALARSADDPDTLAELVARRLDTARAAEVAPLLARLAGLPDLPDRALEVLALAAKAHDPATAASWLDRLHDGGGGGARTWLLRGDMAARLGDLAGAETAWRKVLALVPTTATDEGVLQARADAVKALAERIGAGVTTRPGHALAALRSWSVYYGAPPAANDAAGLARLRASDLLVLEPDQPWHPGLIRRPGQQVLAYLSLGEVHRTRAYYAALAAHPGVLASPNPHWPGATAVDPRSPAWWGVVLESVVPQILAQGYDGLFLDTLDDAAALEAGGDRPGTRDAMAGLVQALRARFPRTVLVGNGGLGMLPQMGKALDAVALESVFTDYQFNPPTYRLRAPDVASARLRDLKAHVQPLALPIFLLEYVDPASPDEARRVADKVRATGAVPFIGTIGLDQLP